VNVGFVHPEPQSLNSTLCDVGQLVFYTHEVRKFEESRAAAVE
jgi:hypothetical protein